MQQPCRPRITIDFSIYTLYNPTHEQKKANVSALEFAGLNDDSRKLLVIVVLAMHTQETGFCQCRKQALCTAQPGVALQACEGLPFSLPFGGMKGNIKQS